MKTKNARQIAAEKRAAAVLAQATQWGPSTQRAVIPSGGEASPQAGVVEQGGPAVERGAVLGPGPSQGQQAAPLPMGGQAPVRPQVQVGPSVSIGQDAQAGRASQFGREGQARYTGQTGQRIAGQTGKGHLLAGDTVGAKIKVIGVGGGGCNAVARMVKENIPGVEYICVNTDAQALMRTEAPSRIRIGEQLTKGLGVGGDPSVGRQAAEESREEVAEVLKGADMIFLAAGMGGGTGTGAAPVIAELAKAQDALTIGIVTRPFLWEGAQRKRRAEEGINRLREKVDTLLVIPNESLLALCDRKVTMAAAFKMADEVLRRSITAIAELIMVPGEINLDFADVKTIMKNAGSAMMGIGVGKGDNRATDAARDAINNPLLDVSIEGAKGVLFNITGGDDLTLSEVQAAAEIISKAVDPDANIFFGMTMDHKLEDEVRITLIATGFPNADNSSSFATPETISKLLQDTGRVEERLDIPPFLRKTAAPVARNGKLSASF